MTFIFLPLEGNIMQLSLKFTVNVKLVSTIITFCQISVEITSECFGRQTGTTWLPFLINHCTIVQI